MLVTVITNDKQENCDSLLVTSITVATATTSPASLSILRRFVLLHIYKCSMEA